MKKITLLITCLTISFYGFTQNNCSIAQSITTGSHTVVGIFGAEAPNPICALNGPATASQWYIYSPTTNGVVTVNTDVVGSSGGDTRIHVYTGDCNTLTCVAGNDDISEQNFLSLTTFNATSGTNYYIVFDDRWSSFGFNFDLSITPADCFSVNAFSLDNRSLNTVDISWVNDNSGATTWDIEYGVSGFTQSTGTLISNIAVTNYQFNGLIENTTYDFYIKVNCEIPNGESLWTGPYTFTTIFNCSFYNTLPYTEDFNSQNVLNSCFTIIDGDGDGAAWFQQTFSNTGEDFAGNTINNFNTKDDWLISPPINLVDGTDYNFTYKFNGNTQGNSIANESLEVLLIDANTNTANVLQILHNETGIIQTGLSNNLEANATIINSLYSSTVSGTYYLAFHTYSPPFSGFLFVYDYSINEVLSVDEFETNNFKYTYNSESDILNLKSSQTPFSSFEVYSISGQKIKMNTLSKNTETINLSHINDGVYFVKVYIENQYKTIKLVKY